MFRRILAGLALLCALALPAETTVNTTANKTIVSGNSAQTAFTFSFIGVAAADISVIFTDASGNQTTLTRGSGTTQYQISLNTPVQGAIWGVGGTVTYNPGGTPIATGTTLTILRTLPLTQAITLQNQQSVQSLGKGSEQAVDTAVMETQQVSEQIGRALQMNVANSAPPNPLPPAAQAANQGLCFDGTGNNLIACSLAPAGTISSAMAPVVAASTISAGRTALGLGTMALENINAGTCGGTTIQDDGSGNARVVFTTVADSTAQSVTCAFHAQLHAATGALTYTLPRANTLFNGFGFWVYALTGNVTFAVNASDNFSGMSSGASLIIPNGSQAYVSTNAASSGTWFINVTNTPGFNAPLNLNIQSSVSSNTLIIAIKDRNAVDPTTASPVIIPQSASGGLTPRLITGALSITVPSSATLGTVSAQANRIWIAVFDNGGTPVLGVYNSLSGSNILAWDETSLPSTTAITSGATSAQTWYTAGASLSTNSFRILGYVESTQATAGTWATTPSKLQLYGPGVKKPGDIIQAQFASGASLAMTLQSAANAVWVQTFGSSTTTSVEVADIVHLQLNSSTIASCTIGVNSVIFSDIYPAFAIGLMNVPNTTSATYSLTQSQASYSFVGYQIVAQELQI